MYVLKKSTRKDKKLMVITPEGKVIHFGQAGASDYPNHKDKDRKANYIARHKKRENWTKSGIDTAGYWARWVLWNKKTIRESIRDIEKRYHIKIIYRK